MTLSGWLDSDIIQMARKWHYPDGQTVTLSGWPDIWIYIRQRNVCVALLTLVLMGVGFELTQVFFYFFSIKLSLLDHTLRLTKRILILAIFYHAENLVYKKFYYIKTFLFVKIIEKLIRSCTVLIFLMVALKIWSFSTYFNLVLNRGGGVISIHNW